MLDREDSPWYPSLRLFRQIETTTWPQVVQRVRETLRKTIADGSLVAKENPGRRLQQVDC
jgi:hypothetical protein